MAAQINGVQASFAGGEFSPSLYGRVDISKYLTGLRRGRNINVLPTGGVRNRPGTKMVSVAYDSSHKVRLIPFIASNSVAYVIELGEKYARFYTNDAQVQKAGASAWVTLTNYVIGDYVTQAAVQYYCLVAHAAGTFATDLAAGKWVAMTAYQIVTPWSATDLAALKFAQAGLTMYFAHSSYAPQTLTFTSSASWAVAAYSFINGPFQLQNTTTAFTLTPSALTGSITLTASQALFVANHVNALFEMIWTVSGQTITPALTASVVNWIPTKATWQAVTTGTWSGTILVQTSPDNITWTTVATVTSNGTVSGTASFTDGYLRTIMQSALAFSGTATVVLTGNGDTKGPTTLTAINDATAAAPAGDTVLITLTTLSGTGDTVLLQRSDDAGVTWNLLATYTTNQAATSVATTKTACLVRAIKTINGGGTPAATVNGTTGAAPTRSVSVSTANVSQAIQSGENWAVITTGTWTGKIRVEVSTDGGNNWNLVQALQGGGSDNFNVSGQTGAAQCLLRVSTDFNVAFTGTATLSLTSNSFDWHGVVKVTAYTSATQVTATVQNLSNQDSSGLQSTTATFQWSEGSWSTYRGWPACVTFFQERACFASTSTEPATGWLTKVQGFSGSADFGVSRPLIDSDAISFVLSSLRLNSIQNLVVMPNGMLALTADSEWAISPGSAGVVTPTSISIQPQGSRGSSQIDPAVVGNEIILCQPLGSTVRNLIFQLAVQGFQGDNISLISQHLFTGYTIVSMAYQQEPNSIVWAVRSDGVMLSLTYMREQEVQAWTWHDTSGTFESVCCIPNPTLGINEVWVSTTRTVGGQTLRYIERMMPRDADTVPANQFFVDCGLTYSGAPATNISGLSHLEGRTVSVLADGNVVSGKVVTGGAITLSVAASTVHVGLPFVSDVETLRIEAPDQKGTLQGRKVTIPNLIIRFWNSRGGYVGTDRPTTDGTTNLDPVLQRSADDNLNTAIPLKTMDYGPFSPPGGYTRDAHMFYRQVDPLPFTILAFLPDIHAGER